ncbi:B12-binding domain-containing radical SAM protein [Halioxenophilus sp. WMMB6]|uniref:B12-binding domain-containing radical SAM protein n=1 Tax=Halioxenophilus sp. WMMB6 TaxID=3073815 RepID=UPI00295EDBA8|nr:radical SAM protein [Halioxenophilus sp. WMMB6]
MDNNKVVLITPPYERIAKGYEYVKHITNASPSLGLLHLAAEIREFGYEPSIIESDIFDLTIDEVANQVAESRPAVVGITLFTVGVWCAAEMAAKIKERLPHIVIVVGGPHISSMGPETMERFRVFDYAIIGEGEEPFVALLDALRDGGDINSVPALIYRDESEITAKIVQTPRLAINKDLDRLPMPAWDLLPDFPHAYRPAVYDFPRQPVASIAASRGCPFHCKFCDTSTFGASVRAYSPQRVFEIMQHLQNNYGIKHILFVDDLFTASKKRTTELCNLIIDSGMDITWSCASRTDVIKPETLALMKKAGCWEISFGLESGSNDLLQKMDKAASLDKSIQALQWTHEAGIRSKGLFMLGYPGENHETIAQTKAFLKQVPLTIMHLTKFTPYPGSPIYRDLYGTNIRDDHWEKMNGMNFLWTPEALTQEELNSNYRKIIMSFYQQPRISWYYTKFTFKYPQHFLRLLKFLLLMLKSQLRDRLAKLRGNKPQQTYVNLDS